MCSVSLDKTLPFLSLWPIHEVGRDQCLPVRNTGKKQWLEGMLASGIGAEAFQWARFTVEMSLLQEAAAFLSYML